MSAENEIDWQDKYIRLAADFDNFRKATAKEKKQIISQGKRNAIENLIPIIDDIDLALERSTDKEGFQIIYSKFQKYLNDMGVTSFGKIGDEFNPEIHSAIMTSESGDVEKGRINTIIKNGYLYKDDEISIIMRHAQVIVEK